ncbi:MAG: hypothetical protein ACTHKT_03670 [Solirubrobacterales bacterium]
MFGHRSMGLSRAARALLALAVAVICLGGGAFAAIRPGDDRGIQAKSRKAPSDSAHRPPRPLFIEVPPAVAVGTGFQFRFHIAAPPSRPGGRSGPPRPPATPTRWRHFQGPLDDGDWTSCSSPLRLGRLDPGDHSLAVRALNRHGEGGPAAHYGWSQAEPKEIAIEPRVGSLEPLMPGDPPQQLPVHIVNPNPAPVEVTSLTVVVSPDSPECPGGPNFAVTPSSLSPAAPLSIPAGGSAGLPNASATAPTLALRELPIDQNACQGTSVHLLFSGEARG